MVMRNARRSLRLARGRWRSLGRAMGELVIARVRLRTDHSHLLLNAKPTRRAPRVPLTSDQERLVDQVAFAIPRVSPRIPWRADCLVQALAAERWLRHCGIASQVVIGVKVDGPASLDAHAWLEAGGRIVTGGDIAAFVPLAD